MDKEALINGYFEGSLSDSQLAELERLRETDTAFAKAFDFERDLQSALKKEERREINSLFSNLNIEREREVQDRVPVKKETKVLSLRPWLVAASVAALVGLGAWLLWFTEPDLNAEQLYAANFVPYENVVHPIERGNEMVALKDRAFTAYEDGDYGQALDLFKELQQKQTDSYLEFYEAIVLMQLNRHEEAIPLLEKYISTDGELKDRAIWYLALSHLKRNELNKSKDQLEILVQQNGFKAQAARELLSGL
ncbi:hypothetical protein [Maribacter sp. 2307ULW6-5]|uniref:hypothetical protein n=1 Tax=Maribacter sp. 2307ULW6-5 TaxID=3386275 RepID=UPI0039BCB433